MAVFTPVSQDELQEWLSCYDAGILLEMSPISSGIENTNYFVTTRNGQFVLTIFEKLSFGELPYYLRLMAHLAERHVPCPKPVVNKDGGLVTALCGKPASLVSRLSGASQMNPTPEQCRNFGQQVAQLHLGALDYPARQPNPRGPEWWMSTAPKIHPFLNDNQRRLLSNELAFQSSHRFDDLPRGPIHADLFRDNVLFEGNRVSGIIDFYFAGHDAWLYDLAIVVNDWCMTPEATLDPVRVDALLDAYREHRPLKPQEAQAWPVMLRAGALRFWLSRLFDLHLPRPGELLHPHDPMWFERILRHHQGSENRWPL